MKRLFLLGSVALLVMAQSKKTPASPPAETSVAIDGKTISIKYSSPSMKGLTIFGGLVPYGQVWRAGANNATALHTDAALDIGGVNVPAGDYTLYVLPTAESWQLIINKQTGQWGTEYNAGQDLGRAKMTLSKPPAPVESYKMTLSATGGKSGKLQLEWADVIASVPITAK
jgi:hypothetical protein